MVCVIYLSKTVIQHDEVLNFALLNDSLFLNYLQWAYITLTISKNKDLKNILIFFPVKSLHKYISYHIIISSFSHQTSLHCPKELASFFRWTLAQHLWQKCHQLQLQRMSRNMILQKHRAARGIRFKQERPREKAAGPLPSCPQEAMSCWGVTSLYSVLFYFSSFDLLKRKIQNKKEQHKTWYYSILLSPLITF